ncbi:hypothetical protein AMTRI_Chr01g108360 [Amborella trichopoda]
MLFILSRIASNVPLVHAVVHQFKSEREAQSKSTTNYIVFNLPEGEGRVMIPLPANAYFSSWSTFGTGRCLLNSDNLFIGLFYETSRLDMVAASSTSTTKEHYTKTNGKGFYVSSTA